MRMTWLNITTLVLTSLAVVQATATNARAQRRCPPGDRDPSCFVAPPAGGGIPVKKMTPEELRQWNEGFKAQRRTNQQAAQVLPSVDTVKRDMKGNGERDSAARAYAALFFLTSISEHLFNDRSRAAEYLGAQATYTGLHPDLCNQERGCAPPERQSRFYFCRIEYVTSAKFLRGLLDKYLPAWQQSAARLAQNGKVFQEAMALQAESARTFQPPSRACTTEGQFSWSDNQAEHAATIAARAAVERARADDNAKAAEDAVGRPWVRQMEVDLQKASKAHVDMTVFGIPLGKKLDLPSCDDVGHAEDGLFGKQIVTPKTCFLSAKQTQDMCKTLMLSALLSCDERTRSIQWGDNVRPSWAQMVTPNLKGNVMIGVTIGFQAAPQPVAVAAIGAGAAQWGADLARKMGDANVAKAHKQLRDKYGTPTHSKPFSYKNGYGALLREVDEMEWMLPGLHVKYDSDTYWDTVTIEAESVFKEKTESQRADEKAEPKL
jgi:hypothetical protein